MIIISQETYRGNKWFVYFMATFISMFSLMVSSFLILVSWILLHYTLSLFVLVVIPLILVLVTFLYFALRKILFLSPYQIIIKDNYVEFQCVLRNYVYNKDIIGIYKGLGRGEVYNIAVENMEKSIKFTIGTLSFGQELHKLIDCIEK